MDIHPSAKLDSSGNEENNNKKMEGKSTVSDVSSNDLDDKSDNTEGDNSNCTIYENPQGRRYEGAETVESVVIKSVLSREASSGSTDSKKNKRVTFHPSVGDSDQEVNEYFAEYDYPEYDDDVYEADSIQREQGEGDEAREEGEGEGDSGGTSYHDLKRAALYALRRGDRWSEGEGDGEKADVGDQSDDETLVNDPDASFNETQEEDSMYPDEFVDDVGDVVDSEEEFLEQLEDVVVPPELEGIDPYLLASMLEEIQEQQDREGSPSGRPEKENSINNIEEFQGFVDKFTIQILEGAAEDLYEYFQHTGGLLDDSAEHDKETKGLEVIPEVDSAEDGNDENETYSDRKNSSGFIEKESLVQNLKEIISELSEVEKPPSECSTERGTVDLGPMESSPIPSPVTHQNVNLFQAMKKNAQLSFDMIEGEKSLFEGDLFNSEEIKNDFMALKERHVNAAEVKGSYLENSDLDNDSTMTEDNNNTIVELLSGKDPNNLDHQMLHEITNNVSTLAEKMSTQILQSALAVFAVSPRKRNLDDDNAHYRPKLAKLELNEDLEMEEIIRESESNYVNEVTPETGNVDLILSESKMESGADLDEVDLIIREKIKTRKKFNRRPQKMKSRFPSFSGESENINDSNKIEYAHVNQGIIFGSDEFQVRKIRKPILREKYLGFCKDENDDTGHIAAAVMYEQYLISRANWYQSDLNLSDSKNSANTEDGEGINVVKFDKSQVEWSLISERCDFSQPLKSSFTDQRLFKDQPHSAKGESHGLVEPRKLESAAGVDDVDLTVREKVKTRKKFNKSILQVKMLVQYLLFKPCFSPWPRIYKS